MNWGGKVPEITAQAESMKTLPGEFQGIGADGENVTNPQLLR